MTHRKVDTGETEVRKGEVYRHKRRGTSYTVVGRASLQTDKLLGDEELLVIYQGSDGVLWARPAREFRDGRFERVEEFSAVKIRKSQTG